MMKKIMIATLASAVAFSTLVTVAAPAQAASYKISKGKLVNAKTGKVVKGTVVYKKKLYKNGVLKKGTTLYKKMLYVDGKIKSGIVQYKGIFYKKGVKVAAGKKFVYKNKLYVGQKLSTGYVKYNNPEFGQMLYYNGKAFTGIYKSVPYDEGYGLVGDNLNENQGLLYKPDGTQIVYSFNFESVYQDIDVKNAKAIVTNDDTVQVANVQLKDQRLFVTIDNTKRDANYELTISGVDIKKIGEWTNTVKFTGLNKKLEAMDGFNTLNATYWKYKDATAAQLDKASLDELSEVNMYLTDYGMNGYNSSSINDGSYSTLTLELYRLFDARLDIGPEL